MIARMFYDLTMEDKDADQGGRGCEWCGGLLRGRQSTWCGNACRKAAWYADHSAESIQAVADWRRRNPERLRANLRLYYERHAEEVKAKQRLRYRADPVSAKVHYHWRRARLDAGPGYSREEWLALVEEHGHRCAYCSAAVAPTVDHRIPIKDGGPNTIDNILPACRDCNYRKGTRSELEFRALLALETLERSRGFKEAEAPFYPTILQFRPASI